MAQSRYDQNVFINCPFDAEAFRADLPTVCSELKLDVANLAFADFSYIVARWLHEHPWRTTG